ncbi:MAG: Asp-tRNA(Asn)/Glu-tRNA(Gln) amidotransferase subunit GatA [Polyangiaceae bacterium]|nr:Asp-tRNA(Asn)/Glu-tRNA(Gln) amidotransferase subunit GatA [Polyangiaceae bacterium]MCW5791013.1 Asp-tRNA(Asn)/Glu-tRNA(Gln) amidotransferase subunit GatA [Polyangiaceae bacterium]
MAPHRAAPHEGAPQGDHDAPRDGASQAARALRERVARGDVSAEQVVSEALERIDAHAELGAFLHVARGAAQDQARAVDAKRRAGEPLGALAGVPVAVKDSLVTRDAPTTAGSRILTRTGELQSAWRPPYDAHVVERLRASDAILIGKTNLDELAMGSSSEHSAFFPVKNPWDLTRSPGGSSGGSAASVSAALTPLSLGSDTGGSIRQPAAFCGVVGLKPSYGRVSRYGLVAFASSLDVVGPFARDVRDAALLFDVIAGHDPRDQTSARAPSAPTAEALERLTLQDLEGLRVGLPREHYEAELHPEVRAALNRLQAALTEAGATVVETRLPSTRYAVASYYVIATAEASSNLSRFDGVRFGLRAEPSGGDLHALYAETRGRGFGAEVKRRILLGTYALSAGYYDAYYRRAQAARRAITAELEAALEQVDVLLTPTAPEPAFRLGERTRDPLAMYLTDLLTLPASLAGLPAISLPCGFTGASQEHLALPIGCQLIGRRLREPELLRAARLVELLLDLPGEPAPALGGRPAQQGEALTTQPTT